MSFEVKLPAVGESIASGTIAQWHKQTGDYVNRGEVLVTIETDKISTELEADKAGILEIKVPEGEEVPIGAVLAVIAPGEASQRADEDEYEEDGGPVSEGVEAPVASPEEPRPVRNENDGGGAGESAGKSEAADGGSHDDVGRPKISPALTVVESRPVPAASDGETTSVEREDAPDGDRASRRKMSPLRKKIATHLVSAQQSAAVLSTFNECDMSAVMALRKTLQKVFVERHGVKLGFMSFFVKAVVSALQEVPGINARIDGDHIVTNHYFDIGVAVSTERGLIVPVIRDCEAKSFAQIEKDIVEAATKARDGKIVLEDLQGGVFTISNGGIYGSLLSTPILNPPQSGILGMHTIQERPIAVDGEVVIRPMMYLALSYDHRLVDGREAVQFLIRVKECIEAPERLLVEA
ncbi:MAG: 2-oxoglutarate dehydrogenase complex dihydrolipoyllysine-residue succinyltransferase [Verrucomicrobiota bacterium]